MNINKDIATDKKVATYVRTASLYAKCSGKEASNRALITLTTRKACYRKDDRAMRPIYRLFYHNFVHAYVHYFVRI